MTVKVAPKEGLDEHDHIFDGFAHRPFQDDLDGWRNRLPDPRHYSCVGAARSTLDLFRDLEHARIRIWELEKTLLRYTPDLPPSRVE